MCSPALPPAIVKLARFRCCGLKPSSIFYPVRRGVGPNCVEALVREMWPVPAVQLASLSSPQSVGQPLG